MSQLQAYSAMMSKLRVRLAEDDREARGAHRIQDLLYAFGEVVRERYAETLTRSPEQLRNLFRWHLVSVLERLALAGCSLSPTAPTGGSHVPTHLRSRVATVNALAFLLDRGLSGDAPLSVVDMLRQAPRPDVSQLPDGGPDASLMAAWYRGACHELLALADAIAFHFGDRGRLDAVPLGPLRQSVPSSSYLGILRSWSSGIPADVTEVDHPGIRRLCTDLLHQATSIAAGHELTTVAWIPNGAAQVMSSDMPEVREYGLLHLSVTLDGRRDAA